MQDKQQFEEEKIPQFDDRLNNISEGEEDGKRREIEDT